VLIAWPETRIASAGASPFQLFSCQYLFSLQAFGPFITEKQHPLMQRCSRVTLPMANPTTATLLSALRLNRDYNVQSQALAVTTHEIRRIRSEQQRAASRRNGAKSKGPKTAAGRVRCGAHNQALPFHRPHNFTASELAAIHAEFVPANQAELSLALSIARLQTQFHQAEHHAEQVFAQNQAAGPEQLHLISIAQQHVQLFEGRLRRRRRELSQLQTQRACQQAEELPLPPLADAEKVTRHRIRLRRLALSEAAGQRAWLRLHGQCNIAMAKTEAAIEDEAVDAVGKKAKIVEVVFAGEDTLNSAAKLKAAENAVQGWFEKYDAVRAHLKCERVEVPSSKQPRSTMHLQKLEELTRDEQRFQSWLENPDTESARKLSPATRARYRRWLARNGK
jgi:hypothetical protein